MTHKFDMYITGIASFSSVGAVLLGLMGIISNGPWSLTFILAVIVLTIGAVTAPVNIRNFVFHRNQLNLQKQP